MERKTNSKKQNKNLKMILKLMKLFVFQTNILHIH